MWHPTKYASMLAEKIEQHGTAGEKEGEEGWGGYWVAGRPSAWPAEIRCRSWWRGRHGSSTCGKKKKKKTPAPRPAVWLINTGWTGGSYGTGYRFKLRHTRAIVDAIHSGELIKAEYEQLPIFNLAVSAGPFEIGVARAWAGPRCGMHAPFLLAFSVSCGTSGPAPHQPHLCLCGAVPFWAGLGWTGWVGPGRGGLPPQRVSAGWLTGPQPPVCPLRRSPKSLPTCPRRCSSPSTPGPTRWAALLACLPACRMWCCYPSPLSARADGHCTAGAMLSGCRRATTRPSSTWPSCSSTTLRPSRWATVELLPFIPCRLLLFSACRGTCQLACRSCPTNVAPHPGEYLPALPCAGWRRPRDPRGGPQDPFCRPSALKACTVCTPSHQQTCTRSR